MSSSTMSVVRDDSRMITPGPRTGGPTSRRVFTPAEKLQHLVAYEEAIRSGGGGAYLREQGIYSSQVTEWRKLRDAGVLAGKAPGQKVGRLAPEQAEIARLRRELEITQRRLGRDFGGRPGDHGKSTRALGADLQELARRRHLVRETLMVTYRELIDAEVSTRAAARLVGIPRATATRIPKTPTRRDKVVPANKLTVTERAEILAVATSPEFVDQPPIQIYAQLLDDGVYLGSVSTIYRVLAENRQVKERRNLARHPARAIPELVATGPGQVFSWDITKLAGPVKGRYFDAYVMIDIYSRYIVGCAVHPAESAILAAEMMTRTFTIHGAPEVVHADRGTSMTSKTVAALLADLDITRSHSRPRVSNDNPYSEAWFKTLKFAPVFPQRFGTIGQARTFMATFVDGYNHTHRHTGIGLNTPADVHYGLAAERTIEREATLAAARANNPERFNSQQTPKILALPANAWINQPAEKTANELAA